MQAQAIGVEQVVGMHKAFIGQFDTEKRPLIAVLGQAMEWVGAATIIPRGARVFIKPNLTWQVPTPGVTTTPQVIRSLVEYLRPITPHITIGESDGGQDCFFAEDAFRSHGLYELVESFGVTVVNLSKQPTERVQTAVARKTIELELPSLLLHETDVFISVPVPKMHAMTRVSMAFKNQWGCLADSMRVREHPRFAEAVVAINKLLRPRLAVCDGTYFLDRTGPLIGDPIRMDLLVVSNDIGAASLACCEIMGVDHRKVRHFQVARAEGMFPNSLDDVQMNSAPQLFSSRKFRLERAPINWVHLLAFHHRFFNRLFYDSILADGLHGLLFLIRRNPLVKSFLYGRFGHGEAQRHGGYYRPY